MRRGRPPLDDDSLIRRAQAGELDAFDELVRRYQEAAFRAAFLVLRSAAEAEDAAQEALFKAYRALHRFRRERAFRPWLLRIVVNEALNMQKARRRRTAMTERLAMSQTDEPELIAEAAADRERARALWSALESLRPRERTILYLRYFLALPERELAEYLGCAPGTVKSRLHRALRRLREVVTRGHPELLREEAP